VALKSTLGLQGDNIRYLAPLTTLFPQTTPMSRRILAGSPNQGHGETAIWAFAFTSQNAVHAIAQALERQTDQDIRAAWLNMPVYCLTGATLTAVRNVGFTLINTLPSTSTLSATTTNELIFENAAQLADFLVSIPWPTSSPTSPSSDQHPPELWFLTGETRMKTMAQTLAAHQKPFQEVVVYETGPSPEFDHELEQWLVSSSCSSSISMASSVETPREARENTLWMVGFSPRGVDLSIPALKRYIFATEAEEVQINSSDQNLSTCVRWAAIGPTTAKQIQQHLQEFSSHVELGKEPVRRRRIDGSVTVAKSPNSVALAESIATALRE
ncbi:hypothetical protein BGZ93_010246, partial [Podila epicladia]